LLSADSTFPDRRETQTQDAFQAEDLAVMSEARRYAAHLFALMAPFIGSRVLEVGAGIGTMSQRLVEIADVVVGIEPNVACATRARAVMEGADRFQLIARHLEECDRAELNAHRFDTIVCSNVLEHIQDDVHALAMFRDIVASTTGRVLIFVPASQAAYGSLDVAMGHHRRYTKPMLREKFQAAGLDLIALKYSNPIGLLGWLYNVRIKRATAHSLAQIRAFERFVAPWALPLERIVTPPLGLSLLAVGQPSRRPR
jgi:cyclopropane fatty-acyl-phospholipid synthase-like methyltransferase